MKRLKTCFSIRGDMVYCPLCLSLDSYWNCLNDCHHCWIRRLNRTWGDDLRPLDIEEFLRKLHNGPKAKNPKTPLAYALQQKKTIRFGNKADPFQSVERSYLVSKVVLEELLKARWSYVIQTMMTDVMMDYQDLIVKAARLRLAIVQPIISCGMERDWEVLERKRTTPIADRLEHLRILRAARVPVAVNGEPFIPGYHTVEEFEEMLKRLKSFGISRYNVYNFHFNDHVAKRFHSIGIDIERIWFENQDPQWKPTLRRLLDLAQKYDIKLGCPDFVNTGPDWKEPANTCCGIEVPNPCTFNTHTFKRLLQAGMYPEDILDSTWDGVGDRLVGRKVMFGKEEPFYTLFDAGMDTNEI